MMDESREHVERLHREAELAHGRLFEMRGQRKPEFWQCVRLIPKAQFAETTQEDFKAATMASSAVCLECNALLNYYPGCNTVVEHMKTKHRRLVKSYSPPSPRKKRRAKKRRKSSEGFASSKGHRDLTTEEKQRVDAALAKWIARRMRPISIVEDEVLQELCNLLGDFGGFRITLPGRTQIRDTIIDDAEELCVRLQQELALHAGYYCLTTDIWTDRSARSYMSLTIHFVDENFKPHNKLLGVIHIPGKHTGARIGAKLVELLDEWKLDMDKCAMLIRDGASNAVKGAESSGLRHMSCIAHSLQLVLAGALMRLRKPAAQNPKLAKKVGGKKKSSKDAQGPVPPVSQVSSTPLASALIAGEECDAQELEELEFHEDSETDNDDEVADNTVDYQAIKQVRDAVHKENDKYISATASTPAKKALDNVRLKVAKFRKIATYFHRSPKAKHRLKRIQETKASLILSLILDCPTRWSSTHSMLERFEAIKADVDAFFSHRATSAGVSEFSDSVLKESLSREDWFYVRCLLRILTPFAQITERLSGEQYPTFVQAFPYLRMIKRYLQREDLFETDYADVRNEPFADQALADMKAVCHAFLELFSERFRGMDQDLMWVPLLDPRLIDMSYLPPEEQDRARNCLVDAMIAIEETKKKSQNTTPIPATATPGFFSPSRVKKQSVIDEFDAVLYGKKEQTRVEISGEAERARLYKKCSTEATLYLSMEEKTKMQPLEWWAANKTAYPIMSKLARKWLGCVATSVPSERAFSTGGNVVTVKRAALTPEMVGHLVMLAQNAKSEVKLDADAPTQEGIEDGVGEENS